MRRFNMWQRIGIVATAAWVIPAAVYWAVQLYRCKPDEPWLCDFIVGEDPPGYGSQFWAFPHAVGFSHLGVVGNAIFATLVFPALVWAVILIAVHTARWIWAGRQD